MSIDDYIPDEMDGLLEEDEKDDYSEGESNYYVTMHWDADNKEVLFRASRTGFKTMLRCLVSLAFDTGGSSAHWHWDATHVFCCDVELIVGRRWSPANGEFQVQHVPIAPIGDSLCGGRYERIAALVGSWLDGKELQCLDIALVEYPEYNEVGLEGGTDELLLIAKNIALLCVASVPGSRFSVCSADPGADAPSITFEYIDCPLEDPWA